MKKTILIMLALGFCFQSGISQSCNDYFPLEEGSQWVLETYDKENKYVSKTIQTIRDAQFNGQTYIGRMVGEVIDSQDKTTGKFDYEVKCEGHQLFISMQSFLNPEQMIAYEDMEVVVDDDFLELPSILDPGMTLADASITVKVVNAGFPIMTINIDIFDRKVESIETVTTPAGTFECVKVTYAARSQMGNDIPIELNTFGAEWFAKGTGLVKSESYYKKQSLAVYTVLTKFIN